MIPLSLVTASLSRRAFLSRSAAWSVLAGSPLAWAAQMATPSPRFEVVSIRRNDSTAWHIGSAPTRYEAVARPLSNTVLNAYLPGWAMRDALKGAPGWLSEELYDFIGQVSEADLPEWQRQRMGPGEKPMLQAMLQAALAERCKLVLHREPRELPCFDLVASKRGPRLKESTGDETIPERSVKMPGAGVMVPIPRDAEKPALIFFQAPMASFAEMIGRVSGYLVVDKTGLTGIYSFSVPRLDQTGLTMADQNPMTVWDISALGLEWKSSKAPTEYLVIDHIERPSPN